MSIELPLRFEDERLLWTVEAVYSPPDTPHMDHWYWPTATQVTLHTVLVYFNEDFEGGETRFIEPIAQLVVPRAGLVVVFQHKLRHEGCPVRSGTKYAMRTDVIYEAAEPIVRS